MPRPTAPTDPDDDIPSRSARRREALDVLAFAGQLAALPPARLSQLDLPADIRDELAVLQRTPSHIAHKRQLAHLAKVMRAHAAADFADARAALANAKVAGVRDAAVLHHTEALRESLLGGDGDDALNAFIAAHPDADRQRLRALVRRARVERDRQQPPRAQRELFRMLRDTL